MKKINMLTMFLLVSYVNNFAFASEDDASISGFLRGNICRAIDAKYPNALAGIKTIPGWIVCRDGGAEFRRWAPQNDPNYIVVKANTKAGNPLTCSARFQQQSQAKTPNIIVACWQ